MLLALRVRARFDACSIARIFFSIALKIIVGFACRAGFCRGMIAPSQAKMVPLPIREDIKRTRRVTP